MSVLRTAAGLVLIDTSNYRARDADVRGGAGGRSRARARRDLHARPRRPRVRHAAVPRRGARASGWPRPRIVGHRAVAARFDRYTAHRRLERADQRASVLDSARPGRREYDYPDIVYDDALRLRRGRRHARARARPRRDRRSHVDLVGRRAASSSPATSSSGWRRTPATPRRSSATRRSGRRRCARWRRARPRCSCPATACRSSAPRACGRRSTTPRSGSSTSCSETVARMNAGATPRADPRGGPAARAPRRSAVPARRLRRAGVRRAQHLAALRRLVGRRAVAPQAGAARRGRRARSRALAGGVEALVARAPRSSPRPATCASAGHLIDWAAAAAPDGRAVHAARAAIYERARGDGRRADDARHLLPRRRRSSARAALA